MKKAIIVGIFMFISLFAFVPVQAHAVSFSDGVLIAAKTNISDLTDGYNQTQDCDGSDSLLGNPDDENSVAWLLNKILTYATIIGMVLVVVLSSIDFLKVITKGDDEAMQKAAKKLALRLVFAALLFFVPTLAAALLDLFGLTSESTCGIGQ